MIMIVREDAHFPLLLHSLPYEAQYYVSHKDVLVDQVTELK